jgi:peroxiredoxin
MRLWPWPAPIDDGRALHLTKGLVLPDIQLPTTGSTTFNLARAKGRTVVVIYPWTGVMGLANPPNWDLIPGAHGSTPELEGFSHLYTAFTGLGIEVFAVSAQAVDYQQDLKQRVCLPFDLASDATHLLQAQLQLPTFETGGVQYLERLTLVSSNGRLERVFYPVHPPDTHARDVLAWCTATAGYAVEAALRRPPNPK